jgi:hypothetical protein
VVDRGEGWGRIYDVVLSAVLDSRSNSLQELELSPDEAGFRAGNAALIERATVMAPQRALAAAVRRKVRHEPPTVTDDFVDRAEAAGLFVVEIDPQGP